MRVCRSVLTRRLCLYICEPPVTAVAPHGSAECLQQKRPQRLNHPPHLWFSLTFANAGVPNKTFELKSQREQAPGSSPVPYWFACGRQRLLHSGQCDLNQCLLEDLLPDGAAVVVILL